MYRRAGVKGNGGLDLLRICLFAVLGLVAAGMPLAVADARAVRDIQFTAESITLHFTAPVDRASAFVIDDPYRLAVDITDAVSGSGGAAGGPFRSIRHGQFDPQTARVVFELASPITVTGGRLTDDGRTLVLSIRSTTERGFRSAVAKGRSVFQSTRLAAARPTGRKGVTVPLGPVRQGVRLPSIQGPSDTNRPLVVIDAGHGGHDPGAPSTLEGRHEKDVTLAIARRLRDDLVRSGRVRVALTRDDDRFLVLGERREIARRLKADLFISIHADSAPNPLARGASVYTLSDVASDRVAAQLAIKENRADVLNGVDLGSESSDVSSILIELTQRETMNISSHFATLLQREMADSVPMRARYHQFANLVVLKAPDVPSVLIETGYLSNKDDAEMLFSKEGQRRIAQAIKRAVEVHFARTLAQL